ncbi:hypothetical protein FGO68_gene12921 [Halteria grandinella]|uniref:Uncharacterized protein n=1 Tax=Halteria grandinella TaxID=5974 RepID=A0A8J8SWW0_HALGN|nr:hypothetical protein FGO68_gene12921 [Halteria grandinella]
MSDNLLPQTLSPARLHLDPLSPPLPRAESTTDQPISLEPPQVSLPPHASAQLPRESSHDLADSQMNHFHLAVGPSATTTAESSANLESEATAPVVEIRQDRKVDLTQDLLSIKCQIATAERKSVCADANMDNASCGSKSGRSFKQLKMLSKRRPQAEEGEGTHDQKKASDEQMVNSQKQESKAKVEEQSQEEKEKEVTKTVERMFQKMSYEERFE